MSNGEDKPGECCPGCAQDVLDKLNAALKSDLLVRAGVNVLANYRTAQPPPPRRPSKSVDRQLQITIEGKAGETLFQEVEGPVFVIMKKIVRDTADQKGVRVKRWLLDGVNIFDDPKWRSYYTDVLTEKFDDPPLGCGVKYNACRKVAVEVEFLVDCKFLACFIGRGLIT